MKTYVSKIITAVAVGMVIITACDYDVTELGPKPAASFTVTPIAGQVNKYLLTSTSSNAFRYDWDKAQGAGYQQGKLVDTVYFPDKGTYTVKLLAFGQSGIDSASQTVVVANDDPAAQTPLKILTGNSSKTWILNPAAGALLVGDNGSTVWWSSSAADVTAADRTCLFNDEYTFTKTGNFIFDAKGDMRVDDEGGNPWPTDIGLPIGCFAMTSIPAKYQAWGSGNFTFSIIGNNVLRVTGTGAHLGLYKVGETGTTANPDPVINYDIIELTPTKLVVRKQYGWGQWRFTFVPKP
jgi:PKD repeat protein